MATVQVRYIVHDVDAAIGCYTKQLGFTRNASGSALSHARFAIEVHDLAATVGALRKAGAHFRNTIVMGVGGKQIIVDDPSGNPIELFEPTMPDARLKERK